MITEAQDLAVDWLRPASRRNYNTPQAQVPESARHEGRGAGDCSVVSASAITGLPYEYTERLMTRWGFDRTGGGIGTVELMKALVELGMSEVDIPGSYDGRYYGVTFTQFRRLFPVGRFVVLTRTHAAGMVDGELVDSWNSMGLSGRVRVRWAFQESQERLV